MFSGERDRLQAFIRREYAAGREPAAVAMSAQKYAADAARLARWLIAMQERRRQGGSGLAGRVQA